MNILLILIAAAIAVVLYFKLNTKSTDDQSDIYFVPEGVSNQRVKDLGLRQESENDPGILRIENIRFPDEIPESEDYRGTPEIEWIVEIKPSKNFIFKKDQFLSIFDYEWRRQFPSEFYAHFPATNRWSFAIAGDSPEEFDSLELGVPLAGVFDDIVLSADVLESYLKELKRRLAKFGADFEIVLKETPEEASARSAKLRALQRDIDPEIIVVLNADSHFKSQHFWNTLVDVGLKWGDGDLFHWRNPGDEGDDHFFSVWTSTSPGYFLPEEVVAGETKPENLIFGFSIARSADPERVFEMMMEATKYCRDKLGGNLLDGNGNPFNEEDYKARIRNTVRRMSEHELPPGQGITLRLF